MKPDTTVSIRPLSEDDSLEELTELLHRAYKVLADMGLKFLATWQDVETTRKRISNGTCFVALKDDRIVGTITFKMPHAGHGVAWLDRPDIGHISQMAVEPAYQNRGIGACLMKHAEDHARAQGLAELALDTSEQAHHLISWYERLGYRFVECVQWDVTNYRSVVMSKTLADG
ncbi:MAG: GNAT family N-acetyltransferase [candidate division Zixibacteria bacterium]|nr:GNAT family N-acetyltransferase [candidate division Zixibacteria bacterium]